MTDAERPRGRRRCARSSPPRSRTSPASGSSGTRTKWPSGAASASCSRPASFPALPGALAVAARGLRTGGDQRNREFVAGAAELEGLPEELDILGFDPQTAGGLLVSIPAEKGAVLEADFAGARPLARAHRPGVEGTGLALV